ncbi:MAG: hypothetical protein JRM84_03805 [Nitrososphaerota archaeon]|nr:hypothetical protein [Nitrososphaerota archaeon]MDG6932785.1 hypothetical protein [Nitrososphaerota archaeon]MDG6944124.1 hypothetical protein [Nitrososphaerota archaeon]
MSDPLSLFNFDIKFDEVSRYGNAGVYRHGDDEYVIDSEEGRRIASDPSIYGGPFEESNLAMARYAVRFMKELGLLDEKLVIQHVLRASLGYRIRDALQETGKEFGELWTRPVYSYTSYRTHTVDDLTISHDAPDTIPASGDFYLLKPDTEASGFTSLKVLDNFFKKCSAQNCRVKAVVLYGFISRVAVDRVKSYLSSKNVKTITIAIENITPLSENGYDMPLYGIDDQAYSSRGTKVKLASAVPTTVLQSMLYDYYPGMDQPGDWSDRQTRLYDGTTWNKVDPLVHLNRSLKILEKMRAINRTEEWYTERHEKIYSKLKDKLNAEIQRNSG